MALVLQHGGIDRKVTAQLDSSPSLTPRSCEPVENYLTLVRRQETFEVVQNSFSRPDTMDSDDLAATLSTAPQDMLEYALLYFQRLEIAWTCIQTDLAYIAGLRKIAIPEVDFTLPFSNQLRMQP